MCRCVIDLGDHIDTKDINPTPDWNIVGVGTVIRQEDWHFGVADSNQDMVVFKLDAELNTIDTEEISKPAPTILRYPPPSASEVTIQLPIEIHNAYIAIRDTKNSLIKNNTTNSSNLQLPKSTYWLRVQTATLLY